MRLPRFKHQPLEHHGPKLLSENPSQKNPLLKNRPLTRLPRRLTVHLDPSVEFEGSLHALSHEALSLDQIFYGATRWDHWQHVLLVWHLHIQDGRTRRINQASQRRLQIALLRNGFGLPAKALRD